MFIDIVAPHVTIIKKNATDPKSLFHVPETKYIAYHIHLRTMRKCHDYLQQIMGENDSLDWSFRMTYYQFIRVSGSIEINGIKVSTGDISF